MSDPEDRILLTILTYSLHCEVVHQSLRMLMDHIRARAFIIPKGIDICIISIHQDSSLRALQAYRQ
jgi:hypothetical protein